MNGSHSTKLTLAAVALATSAVFVLAGCSAQSSNSGDTPSTATSAAAGGTQGQGGQTGQGGPSGGVTGQIAAVQGSTLQVQSQSMQTAVTFSGSTKITVEKTVSLSDVKVGECVVATDAFSTSGATPAPGAAVASVAISQPVSGSCTGGFGGGAGGGRGFGGGAGAGAGASSFPRPTGVPSNRPSGGFAGRAFAIPTFGKVTAVSGSTITVNAVARTAGSTTSSTTSKKVAVGPSTKYTETVAGTSSALVAGQCVVARGKADSSGDVAATTLAVSSPTANGCTTGFAGRGFGGGTAGSTSGSGANS